MEMIPDLNGAYAVYRYHLDSPLGDWTRPRMWAGHYCGSTPDLERRDGEHRDGTGARLLRAANEQGIDYHLSVVYACANQQVAEDLEQYFKARGHHDQFCAHCQAIARGDIPPAHPVVIEVNSVEDVARVRRPISSILGNRLRYLTERARKRDHTMAQSGTPIPPPRRPADQGDPHRWVTLTECEARALGYYVTDLAAANRDIVHGDYPIDLITEEEWQAIRARRAEIGT